MTISQADYSSVKKFNKSGMEEIHSTSSYKLGVKEPNADLAYRASGEALRLYGVIRDISRELGVPAPGCPAPVANAAEIALRILGEWDDGDSQN